MLDITIWLAHLFIGVVSSRVVANNFGDSGATTYTVTVGFVLAIFASVQFYL